MSALREQKTGSDNLSSTSPATSKASRKLGKAKKTTHHYVATPQRQSSFQISAVRHQSRRHKKGSEVHEIIDDRGSDLSSTESLHLGNNATPADSNHNVSAAGELGSAIIDRHMQEKLQR